MRRRYTAGIKAAVILAVALGWIETSWRGEPLAAAAQSNNGQNPAAQEEKPFDQKQALSELRKKIAGQENKPSGEVFKNIQIPLFQKLPSRLLL